MSNAGSIPRNPGHRERRRAGRPSPHQLAVRAIGVERERLAQFVERTRLDLTHALAGDAEALAGLLQRVRDPILEAVPDAQDLLLALAERAQQAIDLLVLELEVDQMLDRRGRPAEVLGAQLLNASSPDPSSSERNPDTISRSNA